MDRHSARASAAAAITTTSVTQSNFSYTNTAKLPIEVVKRLISAVERRPSLWLRNNTNGQKRCDITPLWYEVSKDCNLPVDICRIKWGHLRDNFRKVYIRNNLTDATPTTWRFYNDMRFMEQPVAENIISQNRSGRKTIHSHDSNSEINFKITTPDISVPICELTEGYDREIHQPSFSDISSFFDDSRTSPPMKRIKFEGKIIPTFTTGMSGDYTAPDDRSLENDDHLNDDDFDEDAATDENEAEPVSEQSQIKTEGPNNTDLFTIEVFDDEEEQDKISTKQCKSKNPNVPDNAMLLKRLPFKNITVDAATNTESHIVGSPDDPDRMFLLSLLPFMQKIDEKSKLRVRQKFQTALIEEFG